MANARGYTALMLAVTGGHAEVAVHLLEHHPELQVRASGMRTTAVSNICISLYTWDYVWVINVTEQYCGDVTLLGLVVCHLTNIGPLVYARRCAKAT